MTDHYEFMLGGRRRLADGVRPCVPGPIVRRSPSTSATPCGDGLGPSGLARWNAVAPHRGDLQRAGDDRAAPFQRDAQGVQLLPLKLQFHVQVVAAGGPGLSKMIEQPPIAVQGDLSMPLVGGRQRPAAVRARRPRLLRRDIAAIVYRWARHRASVRPPEHPRLHPRSGPGRAGRVTSLTPPFHNGRTGGMKTGTEIIKRQMYGRTGFTLLRHRLLLSQHHAPSSPKV